MLVPLTDKGIKTLSAILCLLTKEIPAITTVVNSQWVNCEKEHLLEIDKHFLRVQEETEWIRKLQGIKIAA